MTKQLTAIAIVAHPDDIEFNMAGTLLLLKQAGADIHFWNLANGCYGTVEYTKDEITRMRWEEAQNAARLAGASIYPPIVDDMGIYYNARQLEQVAAVVRRVKPEIILTHSPQDYMEDHMNTSRLTVSAAFTRGMPLYPTNPPEAPWMADTVIYHAMPHSLRDPLYRVVRAEFYVDITAVLEQKTALLAEHKSQKEWLDVSQGMDSYLATMQETSRAVGRMSGRFEAAEGWRRHAPPGYATRGYDPLRAALDASLWHADERYAQSLEG
jgi:LmbE family N-acetylglucosaminyl deacetylase